MKSSEFVEIRKGLKDTPYWEKAWEISINGKKTYRSLNKLQGILNRELRDYDYKSFVEVRNQLTDTFKHYKDLLGNIIYKCEDEEAQERYQEDIETINENLQRSAQFAGKTGNKKLVMVEAFVEMWRILRHILIIMNDIQKHDDDFEESVVYIMRLKGGKEIGEKPMPPTPDENILSGGEEGQDVEVKEIEGEEEGEEEKEEEEIPETGKDAFLQVQERLEEK